MNCTDIAHNINSNTKEEHPSHLCAYPCRNEKTINWEILRRLLQELDITLHDKNLILARFHQIYSHIEKHHYSARLSYNNSKLFIATTSIVNPALLSIMPSAESDSYTGLFWLVWSLQIAVSLVTAYTTFFKCDKKYFMYMVYKQRVEQEIWMYLELTGAYSIVHPLNETEVELMHTTHQSKIKHFLLQLETLYKKLKESDFNIETTDDHDQHRGDQQPVKTNTYNKHILRQKLMTHKIDKQLEAMQHATTEEQKNTIQKNIERLQTLQRQNQFMDMQTNIPLYNTCISAEEVSEQEVEKEQYERYPRK